MYLPQVLFGIVLLCQNELLFAKQMEPGKHTNNWAVIVDTSLFWFNYRHEANALSIYHSVKRLGIPDSNIILMIADEVACNPRNPQPATIYNNMNQAINLFGENIEIDYLGVEVTAENFIRVLTGRHPASTPKTKRLLSDETSNVLIYLNGHGGDGFIKFLDADDISSTEMADTLDQMYKKKRYNEMIFIVDSCRSSSMITPIYTPNIFAVSSSLVHEDSLSHHNDPTIGVHVIDRYPYYLLEFLEPLSQNSDVSVAEFAKICPPSKCISTVNSHYHKFRDPNKVRVMDFFSASHVPRMSKFVANFTAVVGKTVEPKLSKDKTQYFHVDQMLDFRNTVVL